MSVYFTLYIKICKRVLFIAKEPYLVGIGLVALADQATQDIATSTVLYCTVHCTVTVLYTVQYCTVQYSTLQCRVQFM